MECANNLKLIGTVSSYELAFTSNKGPKNEKFYNLVLSVPRLSDKADLIPVMCSEKLLFDVDFEVGKTICVEGKIYTHNYLRDGKSHLSIYAYAYDVSSVSDETEIDPKDRNIVELIGVICRDTHSRKTVKTYRSITDMMLAVDRSYGKKDYIPCIAWGHNATLAGKRKVGDFVHLTGRFQSRQYRKKGVSSELTAYEVSVIDLSVVQEDKEEVAAASE